MAPRGDLWRRNTLMCPEMTQAPVEAADKPKNLVDPEQDAGSGGPSTDLARESPIASPRLIPVSAMASPRLIPVPDSPPPSKQVPPTSPAEGNGAASASFGRNCASS